jgi:hypothetical protein
MFRYVLPPRSDRGTMRNKERHMITLKQEQARLLAETLESPPAVVDPNTQ